MKLPAQLADRSSFVMHEDQAVFHLLTIAYELHEVVLRVLTTSSAEPMARSMRERRSLLLSGLHLRNPSKTVWQTSRNERSLAPNPRGLACLGSTTSQGWDRIAAYSQLGRDSRYPINLAASR